MMDMLWKKVPELKLLILDGKKNGSEFWIEES